MSAFELVFGLMTFITSLALTQLLAGFVGLLRNGERVQCSALHALWEWSALTSAIGNWASYWGLRSLGDLRAAHLLPDRYQQCRDGLTVRVPK